MQWPKSIISQNSTTVKNRRPSWQNCTLTMASPFELQHRYGPVYLTPLHRPGSHINLEDQHIWFNFHLCGNLVVPPGPLHLRGDEWCRLAGWHRAILMRRRIDPAPAFWCLRCENAESHILSCWSPTKPILTLSTVIMDPVIVPAQRCS